MEANKSTNVDNSLIKSILLSVAAIDGIAIEAEGKILYSNQVMSDNFGYSEIELKGMEIKQLISPDDKDILKKILQQDAPESFETLGIRKDESSFVVELSCKHIHKDGHIYNSIVFHDITLRKNVEIELVQSEREYKTLFEDSKDAIYISSRNGHLLDVNKAAIELFGYLKEEMLNLKSKELYANPEDRTKFQIAIEIKGAVRDYEVDLKRKNGDIIKCLLSSSVRYGPGKVMIGYQGIIRDITALREAQELAKAKELAEKSSKMKAQFLANMSHEIRTPMNAVFGMTNLLLGSELNERQKEYVNFIRNSSDHLLVLINDILDFSKIDAGKIEFEESEFSIKELVRNMTGTLQIRLEGKNVEFKTNLDENVPEYIMGDAIRLNQVLLNLLTNAEKFTEKGSIELDIELLDESEQNVSLSFSVKDTGIGISKQKLETIFESFTQVNQDADKKYEGTGLGLAISKQLVELQGGSISVESKESIGSLFRVILQFKKGLHDPSLEEPQVLDFIPEGELESLNILIVEDNVLNLKVTTETILKWGNKTSMDTAMNGKIAVAKSKKKKYDLIIMDVQMPLVDGFAATRQIRKKLYSKNKHTPILAMTAYATSGDAEKCISAGMNDFISKPFNPQNLLNKIVKLTNASFKTKETTAQPKPSVETTGQTINTSFLNSVTGDNAHLRDEMIRTLLEETPVEVDKMHRQLEDSNLKGLAATAHKFKTSATLFGNKELEKDLKSIEVNIKQEKNIEIIPMLLGRVEKISKLACNELEKELNTTY